MPATSPVTSSNIQQMRPLGVLGGPESAIGLARCRQWPAALRAALPFQTLYPCLRAEQARDLCAVTAGGQMPGAARKGDPHNGILLWGVP